MPRFRLSSMLWLMVAIAAFFSGRHTMREQVLDAYSDMANCRALQSCYEPLAIYDPLRDKMPAVKDPERFSGIGAEFLGWQGNKIIHFRQIHEIPGAGYSMQSLKYLPEYPNHSLPSAFDHHNTLINPEAITENNSRLAPFFEK